MRILFQYIVLVFRLYVAVCVCWFACCGVVAQQIDSISVKTFSKENSKANFHYRIPAGYDHSTKIKYRVLIYFGGRNTTGKREIKDATWSDWCDKNGIVLIVPSYKNDNYWEPQRWSGMALLEAVARLKKMYPNICDDKFLYYGYSAGAQCSNLFPAWMPQKSRAYVSHACGVFHKPNVRMKNVAGLLTCGDADRRRLIINHRFIGTYRNLGINILWKSFPNHPHDVPTGSIYLAQAFLEYYHRLYACDLDSSASRPKESKKIIFTGDDVDGVIYPADSPSAKQIYDEDKVYFYSEELAEAWAKSAKMP